MKIVCLLGSPRPKGNSAAIAGRFLESAESLGAEIQVFALNELEYRGCQACMACKTRLDRCVLKDDLAEILDAVRETDVLVLATPIYFREVTSQVKAFIDRTYSYFVPDFFTSPNPSRLSPGKKLVFIQAQTQPDEKLYADVYARYEPVFKRFGFDATYVILATGVRLPGDVETRDDVMEQAEEIAGKILE